jgi:hypothetical protein
MKWKKSRYLCLTLITSIGLFYACEKVALEPVKVTSASFSKDIQPIFTKNCIGCHDGVIQSPNLKSGSAYKSLTTGGYVNTSSPKDSKLYQQLFISSHIARTTDVEKQEILVWITNGAKND